MLLETIRLKEFAVCRTYARMRTSLLEENTDHVAFHTHFRT